MLISCTRISSEYFMKVSLNSVLCLASATTTSNFQSVSVKLAEFWRPKGFLTFQRALKLSLCPVKTVLSLQTEFHLRDSFSFVWESVDGSVSMLSESIQRSEISVRTVLPPSGRTVIPPVFLRQTKIFSSFNIYGHTIWTPVTPEELESLKSSGWQEAGSFCVRDTCSVKSESNCYHLKLILHVQSEGSKPTTCSVTFPFATTVSKCWLASKLDKH